MRSRVIAAEHYDIENPTPSFRRSTQGRQDHHGKVFAIPAGWTLRCRSRAFGRRKKHAVCTVPVVQYLAYQTYTSYLIFLVAVTVDAHHRLLALFGPTYVVRYLWIVGGSTGRFLYEPRVRSRFCDRGVPVLQSTVNKSHHVVGESAVLLSEIFHSWYC